MNEPHFTKKVDKRSRTSMTDYLKKHFRYFTMNCWNRSESYAHNIKIYNLGLPEDIKEKAYEMLETEDLYRAHINPLIEEFDEEMDHKYQAGFNGRSGGYIVLYQGGYEEKPFFRRGWDPNRYYCDPYKRWFDNKEAEAHPMFDKTYKKIYCTPGKGLDENEDFEEFDMSMLKDRVETVQRFDQLAEDIRDTFIEACKEYRVETEVYYVERKRKVLIP